MKIACEICGSNDLVKMDDAFICQNCGAKYSADELKNSLSVANEQSNKEERINQLESLYAVARRNFASGNAQEALQFYTELQKLDPQNWEPVFYSALSRVQDCKIFQIESAAETVAIAFSNALAMIRKLDKESGIRAENEITQQAASHYMMLSSAAVRHFQKTTANMSSSQVIAECKDELSRRLNKCVISAFVSGDAIEALGFTGKDNARILWETGLKIFSDNHHLCSLNKNAVLGYVEKTGQASGGYTFELKKFHTIAILAGTGIAAAIIGYIFNGWSIIGFSPIRVASIIASGILAIISYNLLRKNKRKIAGYLAILSSVISTLGGTLTRRLLTYGMWSYRYDQIDFYSLAVNTDWILLTAMAILGAFFAWGILRRKEKIISGWMLGVLNAAEWAFSIACLFTSDMSYEGIWLMLMPSCSLLIGFAWLFMIYRTMPASGNIFKMNDKLKEV